LTDVGKVLARTFHECDLLIVECLRQGLLDDLEPAALAGLVSVFVYEHRSPEAPPAAWFPSPTVRKRWQRIAEISYELEEIEEEELSGGDFVRTMKQLIDVLRQLALVAPEAATRNSADRAAEQLFRGVVAASTAVEIIEDRPPGDDTQG
jgi:ATP-dependent RNA helicase HelY